MSFPRPAFPMVNLTAEQLEQLRRRGIKPMDQELAHLTLAVAKNDVEALNILRMLHQFKYVKPALKYMLKRGIVGHFVVEYWVESGCRGASILPMFERLKKEQSGLMFTPVVFKEMKHGT